MEVDDLFLRKLRKLIKVNMSNDNFYFTNIPLMVVGTFLVIIGWSLMTTCGAGTTHTLNSSTARYQSETSFLSCLLAGSVSSINCFLIKRHVVVGDHRKTPRYDVRSACNGFLAGVCAVAAGAGAMRPWGAIITGFFESFFYMLFCLIVKKCKFDDPMENFAIYCSGGMWAMVASAFFTPHSGILWG